MTLSETLLAVALFGGLSAFSMNQMGEIIPTDNIVENTERYTIQESVLIESIEDNVIKGKILVNGQPQIQVEVPVNSVHVNYIKPGYTISTITNGNDYIPGSLEESNKIIIEDMFYGLGQ